MTINDRERFLMREAMKAAQHYSSLDDWLGEVIDDVGHTVEHHLSFDATQHAILINADNDT